MIHLVPKGCFSTLKYDLVRKAAVSPEAFHHAVAATHNYSRFLKWCTRSSVIKRGTDWNDTVLDVSFGLYNVSYKSRVTYERISSDCRIIRSVCQETPFKVIDSRWTITKLEDELTRVDYQLQFQFCNSLYQRAASLFLKQVGEGMYNKFLSEAVRLEKVTKSRNIEEEFGKYYPELWERVLARPELLEEWKKLGREFKFESLSTTKLQQATKELLDH